MWDNIYFVNGCIHIDIQSHYNVIEPNVLKEYIISDHIHVTDRGVIKVVFYLINCNMIWLSDIAHMKCVLHLEKIRQIKENNKPKFIKII